MIIMQILVKVVIELEERMNIRIIFHLMIHLNTNNNNNKLNNNINNNTNNIRPRTSFNSNMTIKMEQTLIGIFYRDKNQTLRIKRKKKMYRKFLKNL